MSRSIVFTSILCGGAFALLIAGNTHAAESATSSKSVDAPVGEACELNANPGGAQQAHPPGPPRCEQESDCTELCPPDALSCTCAPSPHGDTICVPVCASDEDCPAGPGPKLSCDTDKGICIPGRPPGGMGGPGGQQRPGGR